MQINKDSLAARINNIANQRGIPHNTLYSRYFFDCFLVRLAESKYSDRFILKGGLYLSSLLGIDNRSTIDIDFLVKKLKMERDDVITVIQSICKSHSDDGIMFSYVRDSKIKKEDIYGGFSVVIEGRLENVRQQFNIDVTVGDVLFPSEINYSYECIISGEKLSLKSYPLETVVAEKLQTTLARGIRNSRSKDLYDLYILSKLKVDELDASNLKRAFELTCKNRFFPIDSDTCYKTLSEISNDNTQRMRWFSFAKKMKYAQNIKFDEVMAEIKRVASIVL